GLARGVRVELLWVSGAGADDVVRVVAGVQHDGFDLAQVTDLIAHAPGQVDGCLGLVLGGVLLGIGVHDPALGLPRLRQRNRVLALRPVQEPGDHAVLALPDRGGRALSAQCTVNGLDAHLPRTGWRVCLPAGAPALAGLAGRGRGVQRLADGLEVCSGSSDSRAPRPAATPGPRWATWSILCLCRQIPFTRLTWV